MHAAFSGRSGGRSSGCSLGRSSAAREQSMIVAATASHGAPPYLSREDMDFCSAVFDRYRRCRDENRARVEHPAEVNSKTLLQAGDASLASDDFCARLQKIWDERCPAIHEFGEPEKPPCKWYHKWLMGSCPDR